MRPGSPMTFDYKIYPEHALIVTRLCGPATLEELMAMVKRLWEDERYSPRYNGIVDLTDVKLAVAQADLRAVVDFVRGHKSTSSGRWAAVTHSPIATACGMIYQRALRGRHVFEVFSTFEAAKLFIGVSGENGPMPGDVLAWKD